MVFQKFSHSFARYRLEQNNLKIYHGNKRILTPVKKNTNAEEKWEYGPFVTQIVKGRPLTTTQERKIRIMRNYEEFVNKTNLMVSSRKPRVTKFSGQKVEYYTTLSSVFKRDVGEIPKKHFIEVDFKNNKARIIGPNSLGVWITYRNTPPANSGYYQRHGFFYQQDPEFNDLYSKMMNYPDVEVPEFIPIKEIVIGTCLDSGRLVALPEENFNPVIFICGKRRMGKTWLHYSLLDNYYHKLNKKCIDMIDIAHESETHCLEWKQQQFINQLKTIGETTRALPMVYLVPKTNTLKTVPLSEEVGFEITMPFKEWVLDYENILRGSKTWEFEKTATYFRNLLYDDFGKLKSDGLIKCKELKAMNDLVDEDIPKKLTGVKDKIKNVMKDIYTSKILELNLL